MKQYFYYWRLGWVAFVALLLCAIGMNLLTRAVLLATGIDTSDDSVKRIGIAVSVFLIAGLPYAGWVFQLATRKAAVLLRSASSSS